MLFTHMAWRNVWRYRRRSLLTIMTIALGLAFNIFMRAIGDGFHEQMVDNSVRAQIGHIEIHRAGYQNDPALRKTLPDPQRVRMALKDLPHVRGWSLRVLGDGLASTAENSAGVQIVGIDPQAEQSVTTIYRTIIQGKYPDSDEGHWILLGERLAQTIDARLDDKIVLLVQGSQGDMQAQLFRVRGLFRSGSPDLDRGVVFIGRSDAQMLFVIDGGLSEAAILLDNSRSVDETVATLKSRLAGEPVEILPWYSVEPFLRQFIDLDDAFFYIIATILFVVISVGIVNTVMMSVFERVHEFGVMMALGVKPRQVVGLVVLESAALGLAGILAGALLGSGLSIYFAGAGINLSRYAQGASALGITTSIVYPVLTARNLVLSDLAVFAVVLLVSLYPARRAARLRPVEAIRHV
jgi:putative ABC transport system permease protein